MKKKLRILIVDDDRDFAESLADIFELEGYATVIVNSGEQAIEKLQSDHFDITFMDVKLPGRNGVECLLEIQKFQPEARVVMMTGFSVEQLLDQAVENNAWDVLHKPLDIDRILEMLDRIKPAGILVADDDPDFVEGMVDLLQGRGYRVLVARDGTEVLNLVKSRSVDVLILDLCLPVINGVNVYQEIRTAGYSVPTIIVTAYARQNGSDLDELRAMSVTGILTKPFDPKSLLEAVDKLVHENVS